MSETRESLIAALKQAGLELSPCVESRGEESPWFIKLLLALSGWLASVFLLSFFFAVFSLLDDANAKLLVGSVLLGLAFVVFKRGGVTEFVEHGTLAISLAGQLLIAFGLAQLMDRDAHTLWALVLFQGSLAIIMPNFIHRAFSAACAALSFGLAMEEGGMLYLASGLLLIPIAWIWINEFRFPDRIRALRAIGYGLVLGLLVVQYLSRHFSLFGQSESTLLLPPWSGELVAGGVLLCLLWSLFQRAVTAPPLRTMLLSYVAVLVLCLASFQAYGLSMGAIILLLGFAGSNRLLMGLGIVSLLFPISTYYYLLDITLLAKAQTLLLLGILLLATRFIVKHLSQHSDPNEELQDV